MLGPCRLCHSVNARTQRGKPNLFWKCSISEHFETKLLTITTCCFSLLCIRQNIFERVGSFKAFQPKTVFDYWNVVIVQAKMLTSLLSPSDRKILTKHCAHLFPPCRQRSLKDTKRWETNLLQCELDREWHCVYITVLSVPSCFCWKNIWCVSGLLPCAWPG